MTNSWATLVIPPFSDYRIHCPLTIHFTAQIAELQCLLVFLLCVNLHSLIEALHHWEKLCLHWIPAPPYINTLIRNICSWLHNNGWLILRHFQIDYTCSYFCGGVNTLWWKTCKMESFRLPHCWYSVKTCKMMMMMMMMMMNGNNI